MAETLLQHPVLTNFVYPFLIVWGFVFSTKDGFVMTSGMKWGLFAVVTVALIIGILWATGVGGRTYGFLFSQSWSEAFWTNLIFVVLIGVALAAVIRGSGK